MSKRGINIVLLLISIAIILFIANAFYSAFTRSPSNPNTINNTTSSTVSGTVVGNETPLPPEMSISEQTQRANEAAAFNASNADDSDATSPPDTTSTTEVNTEPTVTADPEPSTDNQTAGQLLEAHPELRGALPSIPEAPPATEITQTPTIEVNAEALPLNSSDTSFNTINSSFPAPVGSSSSSFPAPIQNSNNTGSSFPAPIQSNDNIGTGFPAPIQNNNSSFPAPQ